MLPLVYFADLRHDYSGVLSTDCMPLGVAYLKAVLDRSAPDVSSRIFAYPSRLLQAMREAPPHVLLLSNYCWNESLSLRFARLAKELRPGALVVMGGPNIPVDEERQRAFLAQHSEIDIYVRGEGDFLAAEIVRDFLDSGLSIREMSKRQMASAIYRREDGSIAIGPQLPRHAELDEIPSPYLAGIMDEFFDGKLEPFVETNRGCPFTCSYCVQGTGYYGKVRYFSLERVREELTYIARRIAAKCPSQGVLRIADSNYGMYERDVEVAAIIGACQKEYGYPRYIDATTGKNRPDRVIRCVEHVRGAMTLDFAAQSLNPVVLENIRRQTIKLSAYEQLSDYMTAHGHRSNSDLILGLPGETRQSHSEAVYKLIDSGIGELTNFQLMLLKGSDLESTASRRRFSFSSRFRLLPRSFGVYGDERVFEVEEVVVSTDTLPFEDYLECRKLALCVAVFWQDQRLADAFGILSRFDVKPSEGLREVMAELERAGEGLDGFLSCFADETANELWPTREACIEFYSQDGNLERLARGELGHNLLHRNRGLAAFHLWPSVCKVAFRAFRRVLVERGATTRIPDFEVFWADLGVFCLHRNAHGTTAEEILAPARATLRYDIPAWREAGAPLEVAPFRLERPQEYQFTFSPEGYQGLKGALDVWSAEPRAVGKLITRMSPDWRMRLCTRVTVSPASDAKAVSTSK